MVYEKNTNAMTLVDPCGLRKEHTCNDSGGTIWFMKRTHAMTLDVVYEKNTHAMNSNISMWFMKRTHVQ